MDDITAAKKLISCLDLTSLNDSDTIEDIKHLCDRSQTPCGSTATVCIYPQFIPQALQYLSGKTKIATVVNFPQGNLTPEKTQNEIFRALKAGADEIDAVFPYKDFLDGKIDKCAAYLHTIRTACGDHKLKVILETGELQTTRTIKAASQLCIECDADFLKTSTGKTKISATPEAANAMLETIKVSKKNVGFKASGGIKTTEDAKKYLVLAASIMGPNWVSPENFRIGASSLLDNLLLTIKKGF